MSYKGPSSFATIILFVLFSVIGWFILPFINVRLNPDLTSPTVYVTSEYPFANAQTVESELCSTLEGSLTKIRGIKGCKSVSTNGYCAIELNLEKGADIDAFVFEASTVIRSIYSRLPNTSSYPQVSKADVRAAHSLNPTISYVLTSDNGIDHLYRTYKDLINKDFLNIKDIGDVIISGQGNTSYFIKPTEGMDFDRNILDRVVDRLSKSLNKQFIGSVRLDKISSDVYYDRAVQNVNDLKKLEIEIKEGRFTQLDKIAEVKLRNVLPSSLYRVNGQDALILNIFPSRTSNILRLSEKVEEIMNPLRLKKYNVLAIKKLDESIELKKELYSIYFRNAVALVILMCFVYIVSRQLKHVILVFSVVLVNQSIAFILYYIFDIGINIFTVAGITMSIGLIADNAVIIVNNVDRTNDRKILVSILASSIVAIGGLSLIFFLDGNFERLLFDFSAAMLINLLVSIPVTYLFVPALFKQFLTIDPRPVNRKVFMRMIKMREIYSMYLRKANAFKGVTIVIVILGFGLPIFLLPDKIEEKSKIATYYNRTWGDEYFAEKIRNQMNIFLGGAFRLFVKSIPPGSASNEQTKSQLIVKLKFNKGSKIEQNNIVLKRIEKVLKNFDKEILFFESSLNNRINAQILISFKDEVQKSFPFFLKNILSDKALLQGSAQSQIYGIGRGFNNAINAQEYDTSISLKGYNYGVLNAIAKSVRDSLLITGRAEDIIISSRDKAETVSESFPLFSLNSLLEITVNGYDNDILSNMITANFGNQKVLGNINTEDSSPIPVIFSVNQRDPVSLWKFLNSPVGGSDYSNLKLGKIGSIQSIHYSEDIVRFNQEYILNVHYRFIGDMAYNQFIQKQIIKNFKPNLPLGYSLESDFDNKTSKEFSSDLAFVIIAFVVLVLVVCSALYESFLQPIAILLCIVFSMIGVFLSYYYFGYSKESGSYAAFIVVGSLTVSNPMYIINEYNFYKSRFPNRQDSWIYSRALAAKSLPIIITTISAIISLFPFIIEGVESGFWYTVSVGSLGGLVFSVGCVYLVLPALIISKKAKL